MNRAVGGLRQSQSIFAAGIELPSVQHGPLAHGVKWYREQADLKQRVGILSGGFRGWEASPHSRKTL
eukprot:1947986-Amphidinium_carterae.1